MDVHHCHQAGYHGDGVAPNVLYDRNGCCFDPASDGGVDGGILTRNSWRHQHSDDRWPKPALKQQALHKSLLAVNISGTFSPPFAVAQGKQVMLCGGLASGF